MEAGMHSAWQRFDRRRRAWVSFPAGLAGLIVLAGLALAACGCGDRSLILRIDLLSFLDPADTHATYGPVPGGLTDSVTVTAARRLDLLPGLRDVTVVRDVTLYITSLFRNQTG